MPIYAWRRQFMDEYLRLSKQDSAAFRRAKNRFVAALKANRPPEPGFGIRQ